MRVKNSKKNRLETKENLKGKDHNTLKQENYKSHSTI